MVTRSKPPSFHRWKNVEIQFEMTHLSKIYSLVVIYTIYSLLKCNIKVKNTIVNLNYKLLYITHRRLHSNLFYCLQYVFTFIVVVLVAASVSRIGL